MNEETENNAPEELNIDPMAAMPEDPMDSASEAPTAVVDAPAEPEHVQRAVSQEAL